MGKRGPAAKFVVRLSSEERAELEEMICKGIGVAYRLLKARILLKADVSAEGPGWPDARIALACSEPPQGYAGWSLRLLEKRVVELGIVATTSDTTIQRVLKKNAA